MKSSSTETKQFLERFHQASKRLAKTIERLKEITTDGAELAATVERLGVPSYKDDKAIQELASAKLKLESCQKEIPGIEHELEEMIVFDGALYAVYREGAQRAANELMAIYEVRVETVTAVVRPFCHTQDEAEYVAKKMPICYEALSRISHMARKAGTTILPQSPGQITKGMADIDAILSESIKSAPNLLQFLRVDLDTPRRKAVSQLRSTKRFANDGSDKGALPPAGSDDAPAEQMPQGVPAPVDETAAATEPIADLPVETSEATPAAPTRASIYAGIDRAVVARMSPQGRRVFMSRLRAAADACDEPETPPAPPAPPIPPVDY